MTTAAAHDGALTATFTSAPPRITLLTDFVLSELLAALRWRRDDLDEALPSRLAWAGNSHPILAASSAGRLADLDYDPDTMTALMRGYGWTTILLIHRTAENVFSARNPFPIGGVFEDPATGSAAAALGGYLRERNAIQAPATITVLQGHHLDQPSSIQVHIPTIGGIQVTGAAVEIPTDTGMTGAEQAAR